MLLAQLRTAVEVPRQALELYARHIIPIVGLSLIPSAQRFAALTADIPDPLGTLLELVTLAARLALVALVVYLAFHRTPHPGPGYPGRFLRTRWPSLLIQVGLIGTAVVVFDVIPEALARLWFTGDSRDLALGILLALKNPTVIAVTLIWNVLAIRQILWFDPDRDPVSRFRPPRAAHGIPRQGHQGCSGR